MEADSEDIVAARARRTAEVQAFSNTLPVLTHVEYKFLNFLYQLDLLEMMFVILTHGVQNDISVTDAVANMDVKHVKTSMNIISFGKIMTNLIV